MVRRRLLAGDAASRQSRVAGRVLGRRQFLFREDAMSRNGRFTSLRQLPAVVLLVALPFLPNPAAADGAIAIGAPADVSKDGYVYGYQLNAPNMSEASEKALVNCRTAPDASDEAKKLCIVAMTFRNQCVAVAMDPKAGTPGAGWSLGPTKQAAIDQAMANCRATAGASRRDFCQLSNAGCDGH
jgi:hypothetical protein